MYAWMERTTAIVNGLEASDVSDLTEQVGLLASLVSRPAGSVSDIDFNLTKPPDVENLQLLAGSRFIALTWTPPASFAEVSYTEIARFTSEDLANSEKGRISSSAFYQDNVGRGSQVMYYWARHVRDNAGTQVYGDWSDPVSGQTAPELQELLDLLESQLSENQLVDSLESRIDLIDAPTTGLIDRVLAEETTRIAEIARVETEYADEDAALAQQIQSIVATGGSQVFIQDAAPVDSPPGTIEAGARWLDSDDGNRQYLWDDVNDAWTDATDQRLIDNIAAIQAVQTAVVDLENDKAEASDVTTLQTTVGANTAAIQLNIASVDGIEAEFFVKTDIDGLVSGFGLVGDQTGSQFIVSADLFAVGKPGFLTQPLFAVGQIGGADRIVFNADALFGDVSIRNAAIEGIAADKLFAVSGTLAEAIVGVGHITNLMIGNVIQSNNWNATTKTGWRITKDLGLIEAGGITIYDNAGNPIFGTGTGFALNWANINGGGRPEDGATRGATVGVDLRGQSLPQSSFEELGFWRKASASGSVQVVDDTLAAFGGRALRAVGDTAVFYDENAPFDPLATYKVTCRVRSAGDQGRRFFGGVQAVRADGQVVDPNGTVGGIGGHYVLGASVPIDNGAPYREFVGYISGHGAAGGEVGDGTLENPWKLHPDGVYFRPVMFLSWGVSNSNLMLVDYFVIERVQEQITGLNISTYIKSAAIDTLFLAGNAVTIPVNSQGGALPGSGNLGFATSVTISVPIPTPIVLFWSFNQGYNANARWGLELRKSNGTRLIDRYLEAKNDFPSGQVSDFISGTETWDLYWRGENANVQLLQSSLSAIAFKR